MVDAQPRMLSRTCPTIPNLDDKGICVLPVKLQPEKTYAIWVNSQKFKTFKDANGQLAVPYLLVFKGKRRAVSAISQLPDPP